MLPPTRVIFTALEGALLDTSSQSWMAAGEALGGDRAPPRTPRLGELRHKSGTQPLRRKIENGYPFITESGGGLFIPDGYFAKHLEGAVRQGRYFCVAFGLPYADALRRPRSLPTRAGRASSAMRK